jgi:hypothetical protein
MPNTTNFNWPTPADTDLVKDGAAAIRNLGDGVDTSLVDLKGGTTGQILSKASNADMDFAFITPNVGDLTEVQAGTGISVADGTGPIPVVTNTVATAFDAKGDLVVGTGADTFAKLTVGTDGHTLVADSVETTGLKWVAPASGGSNWSLLNAGGTALTGAQTVTVSGISGANKIFVVIDGASGGAQSQLRLRLNTDTGSNYQYYGLRLNPQASYDITMVAAEANNAATGYLWAQTSTNTAAASYGGLYIDGANSSGVKFISSTSGTDQSGGNSGKSFVMQGFYSGSSVITSISVFSGTGNLDAGNVFVYTSA